MKSILQHLKVLLPAVIIVLSSFWPTQAQKVTITQDEPLKEFSVFYNTAQNIATLSSWNTQPDGSGTQPSAFDLDHAHWYIIQDALLMDELNIAGQSSKVIVQGNSLETVTLALMAKLNALVDVDESGQLNILSNHYPQLGEMRTGSKVIFSLDDKVIPYHDYYDLTILGANPVFLEAEDKTVKIRGFLTLTGEVVFPPARGNVEYDFLFHGSSSQGIVTNGNVFRAYNMRFVKPDGLMRLLPTTTVSSDNQLIFNISGDAVFEDNGATFYAGNSVNVGGTAANYDFTGTFILAGTEEGIVNGVGAGNNFNIRQAENSNTNAVAAFNNIIIRAANMGGEFRFRDGSTNLFEIKGNLIIESQAAGRVRFYNNQVIIRGDLKIEDGFGGTIDAFERLGFSGDDTQQLQLAHTIEANQLKIENTIHITSGILQSHQSLDLLAMVTTTQDGVLAIKSNAQFSGISNDIYVKGNFGFQMNNTVLEEYIFPLGTALRFVPPKLNIAHNADNLVLHSARALESELPNLIMPEDLKVILPDYFYFFTLDDSAEIHSASVALPFDADNLGIDIDLLRIAYGNDDGWKNFGAIIEDGYVRTTEPVTESGYFALATYKLPPGSPDLLYFWYFDADLPNNLPLENIEPFFSIPQTALLEYRSALDGYPFGDTHPNWLKASMERINAPTPLNYRPRGNNNLPYDEIAMRGIQIKQPFLANGHENTLVFHLPATLHEDLIFRFAAKDEGAVDAILIDYALEEENWITTGLAHTSLDLTPEFVLYKLDFANIADANRNPNFKIRLRFSADDATLDEGNRVTFNNISLDGRYAGTINHPPVVDNPVALQKTIENGTSITIDLNTVFSDPDNMSLLFSAKSNQPDIVGAHLNGSIVILQPLLRGDAVITVTASDVADNVTSTDFRVLVYPQAHDLLAIPFSFDNWSAEQPEYAYPANMIFLQSDTADPDINAPLLHPYQIPHDDYHAEDVAAIGFPYNTTRRTRINGLGNDGISLINTGRNRDLGGVLAAINTQGIAGLDVMWLAGTIIQNSRKYAIRLQYRVGIEGEFSDVLSSAGLQIEYLVNADGHTQQMGPVRLPEETNHHEYVQLLWRYYHIEGESGARPQLRLDDIFVSWTLNAENKMLTEPEIYAFGKNIVLENQALLSGVLEVFDMTGRKVLSTPIIDTGKSIIPTQLQIGVYVVKYQGEQNSVSQKVIIQ